MYLYYLVVQNECTNLGCLWHWFGIIMFGSISSKNKYYYYILDYIYNTNNESMINIHKQKIK